MTYPLWRMFISLTDVSESRNIMGQIGLIDASNVITMEELLQSDETALAIEDKEAE